MGQSRTAVYSRQVFEHLIDSLSAETSKDWLDIRDDGVWPKHGGFGLDWSPACDMDWHGSPDPLSEPALPFPFTANQLAAWMLDGLGFFFLADAAGEWANGPDKEVLDSLGVRGVKAREALAAAYEAVRAALTDVGEGDRAIVERGWNAASLHEQRLTEVLARKENNWTEPGIDDQESEARRRRYLATVEPGRTALREARHAADKAYAAWRKKMVAKLLPQSGSAPAVPAAVPRGAAQEAAVLAKLRELGFDPLRLPAAPRGKRSPAKQAVRAALKTNMTRAVLDKAWLRLRAKAEIIDG